MKILPGIYEEIDIRQIPAFFIKAWELDNDGLIPIKSELYQIWEMGFMQFSEQMTKTEEIFIKIKEIYGED